jgi:hypothetical protein
LFTFVLFFAALPAFAGAPPPPDTQQKCTPLLKELELVGAAGLMPMVLEDTDRARAVAYINAQEPVTDFTYEIVIAVPSPAGGGYILTGNHGEICFRALLPAEAFRAFMRASMGDVA